jgi:hypothetical protein
MIPAALSASVRIVSRGIPNSSCATLPVIIAAIAALAKAMMTKTALPMSQAYFIALRVANACMGPHPATNLSKKTPVPVFKKRA